MTDDEKLLCSTNGDLDERKQQHEGAWWICISCSIESEERSEEFSTQQIPPEISAFG